MQEKQDQKGGFCENLYLDPIFKTPNFTSPCIQNSYIWVQ